MFLTGFHIGPSMIAGAEAGLSIGAPVARRRLVSASVDLRGPGRFDEQTATAGPDTSQAATRDVDYAKPVFRGVPGTRRALPASVPGVPSHLDVIVAIHDLPVGSEDRVDYRPLLACGKEKQAHDTQTGLPIIGPSWQESLSTSAATPATLLG